MLDLIERVKSDTHCDVKYIWFDTGVEWQATKDHLEYLEERYGIEMARVRGRKSIPTCVREYGQPFLSKYVSEHIERLQRAGFDWKDEPYEELLARFPNCSSALKWWTNKWTRNERPGWFDIGRHKMLKEFMVENPPTFRISQKCCTYAKKYAAHDAYKSMDIDLEIIGVRRAEGGIRAATGTCFSTHDGMDTYRPLYWLSQGDKDTYSELFDIRHSDCYEVWGFKRTGCVGCPFGRDAIKELDIATAFEPALCQVARKLFRESYEYTAAYREYVRARGQQRLFK